MAQIVIFSGTTFDSALMYTKLREVGLADLK